MPDLRDNLLSLYGTEEFLHGLFHQMEQNFVATGSDIAWLEMFREEMRAASPSSLPPAVEHLRVGLSQGDPAYSDEEDGPCLTVDFRSNGDVEAFAASLSALMPFSAVVLGSWPARTFPPDPFPNQVWVDGTLTEQ